MGKGHDGSERKKPLRSGKGSEGTEKGKTGVYVFKG